MKPSVRALIVLGLACFSASGLAQVNNGELPPDTYNRKNLRSRNFDMKVEVTRFTNANPKIMKVTGANEVFEIEVTLGINANYVQPPGENPWTVGFIDTINLQMGGDTVNLVVPSNFFPAAANPPGSPVAQITFRRKITFGTTKFTDGGEIPIKLTTTYSFRRYDSSGANQLEPPQSAGPLVVEVKPVAYNKATFLATQEEVLPNGAYQANLDSVAAQLAKSVVAAGIGGVGPLNHDRLPNSAEAAWTLRANGPPPSGVGPVRGYLNQATALVYCTHGEWVPTLGLRASHTDFMPFMINGADNDIGDWVRTPTRPLEALYNLVVLIACNTMPSNGDRAASRAFGIGEPGETDFRPGVAAVGFAMVVGANNQAAKENIEAIPKWTELFLKLLKEGFTVAQAASTASSEFRIVGRSGDKISPSIRGDRNAQLYGVYGLPKQPTIWFKVTVI